MLRRVGVEGYENHPLFWFELAGVSWSEFAAGTIQAQLKGKRGQSTQGQSPFSPRQKRARGGTRTLTRETRTGF